MKFKHILVSSGQILIGLVLHGLILPLMAPILLVFWVMSQLVKLRLYLEYGSGTKKCSGLDAVWGKETPENRPIITILFTMVGKPSIEKVRNYIKSKILDVEEESGEYRYPKFRQRLFLKFGYYVWQDHPKLDIEYHVTLVNLKNADQSSILAYMSQPEVENLPKTQPQWKVTLLDSEQGRYSVFIVLHHAIGDGISLLRLCLEALADGQPLTQLYATEQKHTFIRALYLLRSVILLPFGLIKIMSSNDNNSLHGKPLSGKKILVYSDGLPLELVRQVKRSAGCTVNDVLMSCLSAASAKLLARRQEELDKITTVVPVSFHYQNEATNMENQFSYGLVKLATSSSLTSPLRLQLIKKEMNNLKKDPTLVAIYWTVAAAFSIIPAAIVENLLTAGGVSVVASNLIGPQQQLLLWDDVVENIVFWVVNRAPLGVGVSMLSYNGVIKTALNVDSALINSTEEAQQFLEDFESELYALDDALQKQEEVYTINANPLMEEV